MIHLNRRGLLVGAAALAGASAISPAFAGEAEAANAVAWLIGDNLSLAGLLYARGGDPKDVAGHLGQARAIAKNISVEIPDFPKPSPDPMQTTADVIHYLIAGDGWHVGEQLAGTYGEAPGKLFEVAVKSNILILLYQPGDDSGVGDIIKARLDGLLPPELWQPVLDTISASKPQDELQQAILTMHSAVADYLVKAAG